jgi:hypothetical protein
MRAMNKRLQRVEAALRPVRRPGTDPETAMQRLAMTRLSTDDLLVLCAMADQGRQDSDWTEQESNAVLALTETWTQLEPGRNEMPASM